MHWCNCRMGVNLRKLSGATEHHCEQKSLPEDPPRQETIFISLGNAKLITSVSPSFVATS